MGYLIDILEFLSIYIILAISLNYLVGNAGLLYVGQIAFFAIGGYTTALLSTNLGVNPLIAMLLGILLSILFTSLLGIITVRLEGHYLLIASLGICEIVRSFVNNSQFTGGAEGILVPGFILETKIIPGQYQMLFITILFLIIELIFFILLDNSPKGRLFKAVRDDSVLVTILGKRVSNIKVEALLISSIWASIAGSLFAHYSRYIDPTSFTVMNSLMLLIAVMIGGIASLWGSIYGGIIIVVLPALIRFIDLPSHIIGPLHRIVFGFILLLILRYKPKGISGKILLK